jgi:hypothetical protein
LQFVFSVLQHSLVSDAALWLRRSALWSTTFLASRSGLSPTCSLYCLSCAYFLFSYLFLLVYSYVHTLFGPFLPATPLPPVPSFSLSSPFTSRQNLFCPYL